MVFIIKSISLFICKWYAIIFMNKIYNTLGLRYICILFFLESLTYVVKHLLSHVIGSISKTKQNSWYSLFIALPLIIPSGILNDVIFQCWKPLKPHSHAWLSFLLVFYIQISKSCHLYLKYKLLSTSTVIILIQDTIIHHCFWSIKPMDSASKFHKKLPPWLNVNHF